MPQRVSVGQATANALAAWLQRKLDPGVNVVAYWPTDNDLTAKTVSVVKAGRRERLDVVMPPVVTASVPVSPTQSTMTIRKGSFVQPIQIDIWATNEPDRDDLVAQLDDALGAPEYETLDDPTATDDPVRDGILVALAEADGFTGNVDCVFDDVDESTDPEHAQSDEWRATYYGTATGEYSAVVTVTRITSAKISLTSSEQTTPPSTTPVDNTTLTPGPNGQGVVVTRTQS